MDQFCIHCFLVLTKYLPIGYPKDIIWLIISMVYHRIQVSCGSYSTTFFIGNEYSDVSDDNFCAQKHTIYGKKIKSISSGAHHNVILTESNQIYVWGKNDWGKLGLGSNNDQTKPTLLELNLASKIKLIKCGSNTTMVITECGECYVCGKNGSGQLGLGDYTDRYSLQKLPINNIIVGGNCDTSSMVLTKRRKMFCLGL